MYFATYISIALAACCNKFNQTGLSHKNTSVATIVYMAYMHPCVHLYTCWVICVQGSTSYLIFVSNHTYYLKFTSLSTQQMIN